MKRILLFTSTLALFLSCKDNSTGPLTPGEMLARITVDGKVEETKEYRNGRLIKESNFGGCDTPFMVHEYSYEGDRIAGSSAAMRGIYSSLSTALCNPEGKYERSERRFEYDKEGRLSSSGNGQTNITYSYDGPVITMRYVNNQTGKVSTETVMKTDANGNIVEVSNPESAGGGVTRYEYDKKVNPLYKIKSMRIGAMSPFESSPNNVIKAYDKNGNVLWERKFSYNLKDLPEKCLETNGVTYHYHYL